MKEHEFMGFKSRFPPEVIIDGRKIGKTEIKEIKDKLEKRLKKMELKKRGEGEKEGTEHVGVSGVLRGQRDVGNGSNIEKQADNQGLPKSIKRSGIQSKQFLMDLKYLDEQIIKGMELDEDLPKKAIKRMFGIDVKVDPSLPEGIMMVNGRSMTMIGTPFEKRGVNQKMIDEYRKTSNLNETMKSTFAFAKDLKKRLRVNADNVVENEQIPMRRSNIQYIDAAREIDALKLELMGDGITGEIEPSRCIEILNVEQFIDKVMKREVFGSMRATRAGLRRAEDFIQMRLLKRLGREQDKLLVNVAGRTELMIPKGIYVHYPSGDGSIYHHSFKALLGENPLMIAMNACNRNQWLKVKMDTISEFEFWVKASPDTNPIRLHDILGIDERRGGVTNRFKCNMKIECHNCVHQISCTRKRKVRKTLAKLYREVN